MASLPFLRSPPFYNAAPSVAAISIGADEGTYPVLDSDLDALAVAQVGACFWGEKPRNVRVVARNHCDVPPQFLADFAADDVVVLADQRASYDMWALAGQAKYIFAQEDDELALIGGALGRTVIGQDLRPIDSDVLRKALRLRLSAAHYRNCFNGESVGIRHAIGCLADWRRHLDGNRGIAAAVGMAFWKKSTIRSFLWNGEQTPPFTSERKALRIAARNNESIGIWPSRVSEGLMDQAEASGISLCKIEDGFLRSRGLGAALHPPGSVVIDRSGLYYDATRPSDLESLLETHDFSTDLLERAAALRHAICQTGVTKYGSVPGQMIDLPEGKRTVLVIGQVDDDMSVKLGGAGVEGNLDFLTRVRSNVADAWIVYRPHPDVVAGHRKGHIPVSTALTLADVIDIGSPLMELVKAVDEVHVLSSLTGFEALMRGKSVTVYGAPFYAGWGLTTDKSQQIERRKRKLSLNELVAGTLILYPRYLDPVTNLPCGPELMVERLASGQQTPINWLIRLRTLQGKLRRFMTISSDKLHG